MGIITAKGVNLPTLAENTTEISALYSEKTGEFDLAASSAGGELISIQSEMITLQKQDISDAVGANQVDNAAGVNLDYLASIKNQTRLLAQKSVAYIQFTNASGSDIIVLINTLFTSSENNESWSLNYEVTVPASSVAYGAVTSANSSITASSNTIDLKTQIVDLTATNNSSAYIGSILESDASLRLRLQKIGTPFTYNLKVGLYLALIALQNVKSVNIKENSTMATVDGVPAKSFNTVIIGGNRAEIAKVIHTFTGCGSASFGSISQLTNAEDGNTYLVYFSEPTERTVNIIVSLTTTSDFDTDAGTGIVRGLIVSLVDALDIGDNLYLQYIESACLIEGVTNVSVALNGSSISLFASHDEIFVTNNSLVSVSN